jgi:hypothetical protein
VSFADDFLTEARFQRAIAEPISATVMRTEVREFLRRIANERDVAIMLDCRIDPHQLRDIHWIDFTLAGGIESLSADIGASTAIVGDTFIVGPTDSIENLRTLIALRMDELDSLPGAAPRQVTSLRRHGPLMWNDLDRPDDLIRSICEREGLQIENAELIPHDLWAGAAIANANAVEQLSIVLMQLDLAFEWNQDATSITLVPYPAEVAVVRAHRPRGMSLDEAEETLRQEFPDLLTEVVANKLSVAARVEVHERIEELLGIREPRDATTTELAPLARRTFTLTVVNQPVGAVMQALVDQGVPIEFDADALTAAGADLSVRVSVQLDKARIRALMEELCEPAGLTFEVDGERVLLDVEE